MSQFKCTRFGLHHYIFVLKVYTSIRYMCIKVTTDLKSSCIHIFVLFTLAKAYGQYLIKMFNCTHSLNLFPFSDVCVMG